MDSIEASSECVFRLQKKYLRAFLYQGFGLIMLMMDCILQTSQVEHCTYRYHYQTSQNNLPLSNQSHMGKSGTDQPWIIFLAAQGGGGAFIRSVQLQGEDVQGVQRSVRGSLQNHTETLSATKHTHALSLEDRSRDLENVEVLGNAVFMTFTCANCERDNEIELRLLVADTGAQVSHVTRQTLVTVIIDSYTTVQPVDGIDDHLFRRPVESGLARTIDSACKKYTIQLSVPANFSREGVLTSLR